MSVLSRVAWRSALGSTTRRAASVTAIGAFGVAIAFGTTACGAGQVSQTTNQLPAVNGAMATVGAMQLRDVQIMYPVTDANKPDEEVFGNGGPFELSFVISNIDPVVNDRLVSITPEKGSVTIVGKTEIKAGEALRAGKPAGLLIPSGAPSVIDEPRIDATLTDAGKTVASGLTTKLTFKFEKAGEVTVNTPVDAGARMERQDVPRGGADAHDEHIVD